MQNLQKKTSPAAHQTKQFSHEMSVVITAENDRAVWSENIGS